MRSDLKGRATRNQRRTLPFTLPAWLLTATLLSACAVVTGRHQANGRAPATTPAFPFARHLRPYHAVGVIKPNHVGPAQLDAATAATYDAWKARYVEPACDPGDYRVKSIPATKAHTVSEAHGYGMMAAVLMAGHDPNARALFDGFHRYYRRHPTLSNARLMAWAQGADCRNVGGSNSATDGDLDIAYALLLADKQWGSGGEIDYGDAARAILAAILKAEVTPAGTLLVGDWVSDPRGRRYRSTRGSDFIPEHFRAFGRAADKADKERWQSVLAKTYSLTSTLQSRFAPATGLLPDFIEEATGESPRPAPPMFLEKTSDGQFSWNACRVPWRISTDYLMAGEFRAQAAMQKLNAWLRGKTGDDPAKIVDGYALDGSDAAQPGATPPSLAFVAPFMVSAMIEPQTGTNQPWLNALWDEVSGRPANEYYGDSIKLFAMILASGNWWTP